LEVAGEELDGGAQGMNDENWPFGHGLCCCGCGEKTNLASHDDARYGSVRGEPNRYIHGHGTRNNWTALPMTFWLHVNQNDLDGCWLWTGAVTGDGYGGITIEGRRFRVHRIAWELANERKIPDGLIVRHLCHVRLCCRPDHLELGTDWDNSQDMTKANRQAKGEEIPQHILTEKQVLEVLALLDAKYEQKQIAREFNVSEATISMIKTGKVWAWLTSRGR
jgi:hypothetical protein